MSEFTIKLRPGDVQKYQEWAAAAEAEAAGWLKVRQELRSYMEQFIDVSHGVNIKNLRDIDLPDLIDEIAAELRDVCPECETRTCHRTKRNPYCAATVYKEKA